MRWMGIAGQRAIIGIAGGGKHGPRQQQVTLPLHQLPTQGVRLARLRSICHSAAISPVGKSSRRGAASLSAAIGGCRVSPAPGA